MLGDKMSYYFKEENGSVKDNGESWHLYDSQWCFDIIEQVVAKSRLVNIEFIRIIYLIIRDIVILS